ncbi:hypothetical protein [Bacteroides neonati]|uniref:hypothetical protein n=1 Tax=Bacteroides neonati TaxID=1347393 RepID=UPI0005A7048C|nr:hypothetical protein [Bacteroides neonati]
MGNKKRSIRFDERTWMLLNELSDKTDSNISIVVRSLVKKGLNELIDDSGNIILNERQVQKE